jgi:hypothetical protein
LEPDSWLHIEDDGLVMAAARGSGGAWCGYLGIPKTMANAYDHAKGVRVHGGLTYEGTESPRSLSTTTVMALSVSGHEMPVFWIGFDCAHFGDLVPEHGWSEGGIYRDLEFVRGEIQRMADQVRGLEEP